MYEEVKKLFLEGYTYRQIAEKLGIKIHNVNQKIYFLRVVGLLPSSLWEPKYKKLVPEIIKLYNEGKNIRQIAKILNVYFFIVGNIVSLLHKTGKLQYRQQYSSCVPLLEKFIEQNKVFSIKDVREFLKKEGLSRSNKTLREHLDKLCENKKINKVYIANLKSFLPSRYYPNILYYTDYNALVNYLLQNLKVTDKKSFMRRVNTLFLPEEVKNKIKQLAK
jgi:hypothetical protein